MLLFPTCPVQQNRTKTFLLGNISELPLAYFHSCRLLITNLFASNFLKIHRSQYEKIVKILRFMVEKERSFFPLILFLFNKHLLNINYTLKAVLCPGVVSMNKT